MDVRTHPSNDKKAANRFAAFFVRRWRGDMPLQTLFWRDMIFVGSLVNLGTTAAAVLLLGFKAPTLLAIAVHFSALPYNIFLLVSVWRTASRLPPAKASAVQMAAAAWMLAATIL